MPDRHRQVAKAHPSVHPQHDRAADDDESDDGDQIVGVPHHHQRPGIVEDSGGNADKVDEVEAMYRFEQAAQTRCRNQQRY
jgi:hypothetical protein